MVTRARWMAAAAVAAVAAGSLSGCKTAGPPPAAAPQTVTAGPAVTEQSPIKHLVVVFQENVSFDRYFGTYPGANGFPQGDPQRVPPQA
ncbi:MAG: phospholipase, partial [Firmicutes bacterium]|nr:phospholipase [Bacillota bacterium]